VVLVERRLQPPRDILDFVRGFNELIIGIDSVIREIDITLRSLDGALRMNPTFELPPLETRQEVPSPSFPGQSPIDYCFECLSRHYEKALGLLEEAHRFSLSAGRVTEGAREKIRKAFHEIVTSEDDLGTRADDPEVKPILDEIKVKVREFRKWLWASGLLTHETDVRKLEEAINRFRAIVDLTWKGAEVVASKRLPLCGYCESLAREVSERYGVSFDEARKLIYGLASDDKEEVRRSIERLKEIGAFEYVYNRVKEILGETGGG
jgi:hypothetical protein